ncbi:MAG: tripartite tricarboxylate transporter substrate binding protein [Betaproteobacteria bacterium]|nr:tripartite tricarboxylate transporter substrate binding protein [Betaproteobacteria bacterium]MBI3937291.1 tripartite tricarboxylate transporter substrate binding protein [Betaproteobacteria bacterium]
MNPRLCVMTLAAALVAATSFTVSAQTYPARPIRIVVAYAAGGGVDIVTRTVGQKLSELVGRPVVVDNRPGASTNIGSELVAKAAHDGYTLLMASSANATNMTLFRKPPYDTLRDFAPVTQVGYGPQVLVTSPSFAARSVKELLALARAKPGQLSYASGGNGSSQHLTGEMFKLMGKAEIVHVPYKGGAPALIDVIGGQVAFMFINTLEALPHAQSGRLKVLAVASAKRSAVFPQTPTFAEAGFPGFESVAWWGVLAPAGTPKEVIGRLHAEIAKALTAPEVKERFAGLGAETVGSTPEQFGAFLREEIQKWGKVIRTLGIKAD